MARLADNAYSGKRACASGETAPAHPVAVSDRHFFERFNPVTGQVASRTPAATLYDAASAASSAASAFPAWSALGPSARRTRLLDAAFLLEDRLETFLSAMAAETGATWEWGRYNVTLGAAMLREAAALSTQITGEVLPSDKPGMISLAVRKPAGVVLGLAPWNAPVILGIRAIATPLACGNTVILKASDISPMTHRLLGEVFRDANLGEDVVRVVASAPSETASIVEALIAHPAVRRVNFTGSTRTGRTIAGMAARYLKPVLLELSGKATLVVLDDADLDEAVKAACYGAFMNQGQICMSTETVIVDEAVADVFAANLARHASTLLAGGSEKGKTPLGPMVGCEAAARIDGLVKDAVSKGARILSGGRCQGPFVDATVLDRVSPAMRIYSEEIFGPVLAIVRVRGAEEAIRVANDSGYGLSSAVFGRDLTRAMDVASRIESGICHINGPTVYDEAQMPFGGMKASGYGRFGGKAAIHEFTDLRWITISTQPGEYRI